ncbi:hypothetical protein [Kitasatospora sp. NPDC094016]|uniref:hypothetical protein n=1 Tax=Kitasatospora sp. NPDC094016 TaxID=3154986 RepID=UPI0033195F94
MFASEQADTEADRARAAEQRRVLPAQAERILDDRQPTTDTNSGHNERFPIVLYRHDTGELMMPATHVTALLRHVAETVRMQRATGKVPLELMTTARIYDAVVRHAADLDTAIAAADTVDTPSSDTGRAAADDLARDLAELAADYLATGEPPKAATA